MTLKSQEDQGLSPEQIELRARLAELAELQAEIERLQAEVDPPPVETELERVDRVAQAARDRIDSLNARKNGPPPVSADEIRRRRREYFRRKP